MSTFQQRLQDINFNIEQTAAAAHRDKNDITLIAVSKTKPIEELQEAYDVGIRNFGENKVQELCDKMEALPKDIHWHMIGHLQRNKVKYIVGKVTLIHSVDSLRLASEISRLAVQNNVHQDILIQVNMGREETKYGVMEEDTLSLIKEIAVLPNIHIKGLMTSAPHVVDSDENLEIFHKIQQLSVDISRENIDNVSMEILSMGMSQDYDAAIREGSTMIRVGSKLFGQRYYDLQ